jgi:hypothetical protein
MLKNSQARRACGDFAQMTIGLAILPTVAEGRSKRKK